MKKITLFLFATLFSALSFAALNPYAYGLKSSHEGTTLTVNYSLNADATGVSVVILDGETEVHTVTCDGKTKGSHSVDISTLGLPTGKSLTWKVNVTGAAVTKATAVSTYRFYHPSSVDIDNNPESAHFGRLLCIEASHSIKTANRDNTFLAKGFGAGIFAFNAAFEPIKNGELAGFNGGNTFTTTHYAVRRIRISDDGRIFVTAQNDGGCFLWEVNPDNLNSWTKVFEGKASTYTTTTPDGKFIAGTNSGFDVHGSGENLKLVMLSANTSGANQATFRCDEYDLGTAKTWSTVPSRTIPGASYHIVTNQSNVQYDKDGGVWHIQYRGTTTDANPGLAHINKNGEEDYKLLRHYTRNAGFCFNKDFTKVIVAGKFQNGTGTQKYATIYAVSKDVDGKPVLTEEQVVDMTNIGYALNDFAWDWADNIYAVDNNGEYLCAYALPHAADKVVSTPCASKYAFELEEIVANVYTLTTNVVGEGTVEGNEGSYVEGTTATLTATPAEHYDFLNWTYGSETSTDNPLTITVNSDMTVTANFQEHTKYTLNAHADDNSKGYVTGGAVDIYVGTNISLKATAKTGYYFTQWNDGNTDNPRAITVTGDAEYIAEFAQAYPRVYAYDLDVADNGDSYTFSFKPNTNAVSGNLLLYNEDGTAVVQTHAISTAIVAHTATSITLNKTELPNQADVPWAIQLSGNAIPAFAETFADANYRFAKGHAAVDNSPESAYFGRVYVADRRSTKANSGLYVYNADLTQLNAEAYKLGMSAAGYSRPAVGADGTVYLTGYTDAESGIFVVDPADLTKCTQFYNGTRASSGLFTNGGVEIGSSTSGVSVYGAGKDAVLYTMMEDGSNANFNSGKQPIVKYQIGQSDGSVLKQWSTAPTWLINYPAKSADKSYNYGNNAFAATEKGVWISQHKTSDGSRPELAFVDKDGNILLMLNQNMCQGAGMAVNSENTHIYIVGVSEILEYNITWTENKPALTLEKSYPVNLPYINTLSLDYAGNLIACAGTGYSNTDNNIMKLVAYTLPTNDNTCIVPAAKAKALKLGVRYNVTVNTVGNGTATGGGEFIEGETATLEATPAAHHKFVNWTYGSETSTDNPLEIVVNTDITVTANFEEILYTLIAPTNDENKGTVTGAGAYSYGTEVTLEATPAAGYKLLYWSDRSTENPRNITMTKNEALSAYFVKEYDVEPTFSIQQVWENTNVLTTTNNGFQAAGWDGKVYVKERLNRSISVYSSATDKELYLYTDEFTSADETNKGDQAIAIDNAGNIIVRSGSGNFFNAPKQITIYKKGEKTGKVINFTLQQSARGDFMSASGDVFSTEGGYVYFYCQNTSVVNRIKITNGATTESDVTVDVIGENITTAQSQNNVMADIFGNVVAHARSTAINAVNVYTNESKSINFPSIKNTTIGGCSFELGGKEFWAYNVGTTSYTSEWNLYNMTDGKFLSNETLYTNNATSVGSIANWLNVQVVDEKTAYIYQFCPKVGAAVWKVTRDHIVSATAENGTVTGAGTYKDNATATLIATPNKGYQFKNWTKNGVEESTENPYSFTVTEDVELVANFEGPFNELILTTNDEAKGTVSGAGFYTAGQTATLTATPAAGYKLLYWSDRSTENPRTITMTKNEAISAYFVKEYTEEPTFKIEKMWENTNVPTSSNNGFQAVGWDEKIYMKDRSNKQILLFSDATPYITYVATDDKDDQPIAIDDAGNIIIRSGSGLFYNAPTQVTIYKNGDKTGKVINFTLPATGRCDFISASGDIYSAEGGYVYFYCQNQTTVSRLYIKNGGASAADISVDKLDNATLTAGSSQSHVFTNIFGDLMTHTRDNNYKVLQEVNVLTGAVSTMNLPNFKNSTLGGCSFELGGKELIAYNIKGTDYNSEWNLYNMTDEVFVSDETLYAKDRISKKTSGAANWLNVQVVDEKTAYIYQFCPEVAVAVWKVTCTTEKTVVIDEEADNTTALAPYEGQLVDKATVKRNFEANKCYTLTLPFGMNASQISDVFGNATVYEFYNIVENGSEELYLEFIPTSSIHAGKPCLIVTPSGSFDANDGFEVEDVIISTTPQYVKVGAVTMMPVLDNGYLMDDPSEYYVWNGGLYCAGTYNMTSKGLRAYFTSSSPLPLRSRVVLKDNEATSIPLVGVETGTQVRKIMKDGRLIIIRGEEQYSIQGQRID